MKRVLDQALESLNQIEFYSTLSVNFNQLAVYNPQRGDSIILKGLLSDTKDTLQKLSSFNKRTYEYSSLIISIYGVLERYIEDLIVEYLSLLNSMITSYLNLPLIIRDNHFEFSAQLIKNLSKPKFAPLTSKEDIINNLHSCITNNNYKLNYHAYIDHAANFRQDTILNSLTNVGILDINNRLIKIKRFERHILTKYNARNIGTIDINTIFSTLSELAERRNEVAHGNISDLLGLGPINDIIQFIKEYVFALYELAKNDYIKLISTNNFTSKITPALNPSSNIVCFISNNGSVTIGDYIICTTSFNEIGINQIVDIHLNNNQVTTATWTSSSTICLKCANKIKKGIDFYLINQNLISSL